MPKLSSSCLNRMLSQILNEREEGGLLVEVGVSSSDVLAMGGEMRANEADGAVHEFHADGGASLVSHHAEETGSGGGGWM